MRLIAIVGACLAVMAACATSPSPAAQPSTTVSTRLTPSSPTVASLPTESGPDTVPFHLDLSNQSFEISEVRLVVEVDDRVIIDDVFAVEDQHNYVRHDLHLDGGPHEIVVTAPDHDVDLHETFDLETERWALIAFWLGEEDATEPFSWSLADEEVGYA